MGIHFDEYYIHKPNRIRCKRDSKYTHGKFHLLCRFRLHLITTAISWSILPPFISLHAIKFYLPQLLVHLIMPFTQPPAQPDLPTDVWRMLLHVLAELRGASRARIQHREGAN